MPTNAGLDAKNWLIDRLNHINPNLFTIQTIKDHKEKYGRYLAILMDDDKNINAEIVAAGHAVPYNGGPR